MKLENIFTFENLFHAHELCRMSKQHKRGTIMFELDLGINIQKLIKSLTDKKYKVGEYKEFTIYDPKMRTIKALPYKDRVVLMCFCKNAMEPRLEKRLIYDNAAARKGKGTDFAIARFHKFMKSLQIKTGTNDGYFLKCDISKYFPSIDHDILLSQLHRAGFSDDEMWFMNMVIKSTGESKGLPLGNQTSQWFALLYLNEIDRLVKEKLRVSHYVRYMDDFILIGENKEFLAQCKIEIQKICAERLNLNLNAKTQIGKLKHGVDFLGFVHKLTPTGKIVKTMRAKAKIRQRNYLKTISRCYLNGIIDDDYLNARCASFRAHMVGTKDRKFITNKINTLRRQKRICENADKT